VWPVKIILVLAQELVWVKYIVWDENKIEASINQADIRLVIETAEAWSGISFLRYVNVF
jgi:hypothetical protein